MKKRTLGLSLIAAALATLAIVLFRPSNGRGGLADGDASREALPATTAPSSERRAVAQRKRNTLRPAHPVVLQSSSQIEHVRPASAQLTEELQPMPPWPGPWPASLAEMPKTPEVVKRLGEVRRPEYLDKDLNQLRKLHDCIGNSIKSEGGVALRFIYEIDATTRLATGTEVEIEQSTLDEVDDPIFIECAHKVHVGSTFRVPDGERAGRMSMPTQINVPINNDRIYHSILGEGPGSWRRRRGN